MKDTTEAPAAPVAAELQELRLRAYGPEADIEDDPGAVRRLAELEDQARQERELPRAERAGWDDPDELGDERSRAGADDPQVAPAVPAEPDPDGSGREDPDPRRGDPSGEHDAGRLDAPSARSAQPWWRRIRVLWPVSIVATAVAVWALSVGIAALDEGRVGVLAVDEDAEWPADMFGDAREGARVFEEFHGMSVYVTPQEWSDDDSLFCLYVRQYDEVGASTGGCAAGAYPPTAAVLVGPDSPDELRERFSDGTALQFVGERDTVEVYAKGP